MAKSKLSFSSVVQYLVILIPLYVFVISPITRTAKSIQNPEEEENDHVNTPNEHLTYAEDDLTCESHDYQVRIFSKEPLVIHVENFITEEEAQHLIDISADKWQTSTVFNGDEETIDLKVRDSSVALIERDHTVKCIEQRAREFQGWLPDVYIERLRTQRYVGPTGHYTYHYDWSGNSDKAGRVSTTLVYISANCTGGGTNFPKIPKPKNEKWCKFTECENEDVKIKGTTFKPIPRSAVYWENFDKRGHGFEETYHAGLPVREGYKTVLNIWSWYQPHGVSLWSDLYQ